MIVKKLTTSSLPYSFPAGFGAGTPQQEAVPKGARNFQELKNCGHGTVLALTVRIIRLALVVIL